MIKTQHYFLPSVRQGLSAAINKDTVVAQRAKVDVSLKLKARQKESGTFDEPALVSQRVELYGPGDILGFDSRIIVRKSPTENTGDFEPNYFPHIEFSDPDFVWRYSAQPAAEETGNIKPWISLVVLASEEQDDNVPEFSFGKRMSDNLPQYITVNTKYLPSLEQAHRWAHVHVTVGEGLDENKLKTLLEQKPEFAVSRLLCTRRLKPGVKYSAFVVPTFKLGAMAGLGESFPDGLDALTPAWSESNTDVKLPYYYHWEFRTGLRGDFEHLVRLLQPRKLTNMGARDINCGSPGYNLPGIERTDTDGPDKHYLAMESALESLNVAYTPWGRDLAINIPDSGVIKNVNVSRVNEHSIAISWQSQSPTKSRVEYGIVEGPEMATELDSPHAEKFFEDPVLKVNHTLILPALEIDNWYILRVIAADNSSVISQTLDKVFYFPRQDAFQLKLAELLNKPNTEDLVAREFDFSATPTEAIKNIEGFAIPTGDKVIIRWQTEQLQESHILFGRSKDYSMSVENSVPKLSHQLTLNKLIPGKTYFYKISIPGSELNPDQSAYGRFTMPPLPFVVPPVYGRWHRGKLKADNKIVDVENQREWLDALNLDPRHRIAAGLGADVIRDNQEALMASAWEQLGDAEKANSYLRHAQLGRDASNAIHRKFASLQLEEYLRITSFAHRKVTDFTQDLDHGRNISAFAHLYNKSRIQRASLDPAFRRIAGPNHRIYKLQRKGKSKFTYRKIATQLGSGNLVPAGSARLVQGTPKMFDVNRRLFNDLQIPEKLSQISTSGLKVRRSLFSDRLSNFRLNRFSLNDALNELLDEDDTKNISTLMQKLNPLGRIKDELIAPSTMQNVFEKWLLRKIHIQERPIAELNFFTAFKSRLSAKIDPNITIKQRSEHRIRNANINSQRFGNGSTGDALDPIMWSPEFPQPMYEVLRDKSQELLLQGIEYIPDNTIGLLKTNRRFMESYLCGCNHEFAGELLWRGYPTDQRGTMFRQFWNVNEYVPKKEELLELLNKWLADNGVNSVQQLSRLQKQSIIVRDLDVAIELITEKYLAIFNKSNSSELPENERSIIDALQQDNYQFLAKVSPDIVNDVVKELVINDQLQEKLADINPITQWQSNSLGDNRNSPNERLVLVLRGDLLKRYPNTLIYAVDAVEDCATQKKVPGMPEFLQCDDVQTAQVLKHVKRTFPVFSAKLLPDITLLGFPFDRESACGCEGSPGKYFIIEEPVSEPRFGLDVPTDSPAMLDSHTWSDDLSWSHFGFSASEDGAHFGEYLDLIPDASKLPEDKLQHWTNASAARIACLTLQKPARIAVHASQMVPKETEPQV